MFNYSHKKSKVIRKHILYIVFTSLSVLLIVVLTFSPVENIFITFKTPGDACEYYYGEDFSTKLIVEGEKSDFVIGHHNDSTSYTYLALPKNENGWKVGIGSDIRRLSFKNIGDVFVQVYQYKNTKDFFVCVFNPNGDDMNISDEAGTSFFLIETENDVTSKTFCTYYGYVYDLSLEYELIVNGDVIRIN